MKRENLRVSYDYYSGKASDIARQLGFAGIAIIWIFKNNQNEIPTDLIFPLKLIVVSLALDFLQYISGSVVWGTYNRYKEWKKVSQDKEFQAPYILNWPALFCFWGKIITIMSAYVFLFFWLHDKIIG